MHFRPVVAMHLSLQELTVLAKACTKLDLVRKLQGGSLGDFVIFRFFLLLQNATKTSENREVFNF